MEVVRENSTSTPQAEKCWPTHWLPKPWAVALHRKLSLLYLAKFTSSFPDQETIDEWASLWAEGLSGINGEQIKHGLNYCQNHHEWPPTCAEFLAACKAAPKPFVMLPVPKGVDSKRGIERVSSVMKSLQASKPIDGRAYWRRVLDNPVVTPETRQFAHEALANLNGGKEAA